MKRFLHFLIAAGIFLVGASAATNTVRSYFQNVVIKKTLFVGSDASYARVADSTCWVEIGSADSSNRAAMLIKWTDTISIGSRKKVGMVIFNKVDSNLWVYTGRRWKKSGN